MEDRCGPESQRYAAASNVASAGHGGQEVNRLARQFDPARMSLVALVLLSKYLLEPLRLHFCQHLVRGSRIVNNEKLVATGFALKVD